jgi:ParB family chromosome partitioning protein
MPERLLSVGIDKLTPDPTQPRKQFIAEVIERLAVSIKTRGMLQPLRVMLYDSASETYLIATGESRWRAAQIAGLTHVPCLLIESRPDEAALLADRIVENECRQDLRPMELARSLAKLKALKGCTWQQLAAELGLSGASISRSAALLSLPETVQEMVDSGRVPESTAYEISRLDDEAGQLELAHAVAAGRCSRDGVAETVRGRIGKRKTRPRASRLACQLEGGLRISVSAADDQPLTWDAFNAAIEQIRKAAKKLYESGKEVGDLARALGMP